MTSNCLYVNDILNLIVDNLIKRECFEFIDGDINSHLHKVLLYKILEGHKPEPIIDSLESCQYIKDIHLLVASNLDSKELVFLMGDSRFEKNIQNNLGRCKYIKESIWYNSQLEMKKLYGK